MTDFKNNILINVNGGEETGSFELFYREYYPVIERMIKINHGSNVEAQDIFQEALLVLFKKFSSKDFKLSCSIKTFLYSISKNLWLKKLYKNKREKQTLSEVYSDTQEESDDITFEELKPVLEKLDYKSKKILQYYYIDKLPMKDIMPLLNYKSVQAVKNKKNKSMKLLIELIRESKITE